MREDCLLNLGGQRARLGRQRRIVQHRAGQLRQFAQGRHREQVAGNIARERAGIIAGAESGVDQPGLAGWAAHPGQGGLGRLVGHPLEPVRAGPGNALLLLEGSDYSPRSLRPAGIEWFGIAAGLPVIVRQAQDIAQRIDLPFALGHPRFHFGLVALRPVQPGG